MNASALVDLYHHSFAGQREAMSSNIALSHGFQTLQRTSNTMMTTILDEIRSFGFNESNAVLVIDGSFSYEIAEFSVSYTSDLDGLLYLQEQTELGTMNHISEQIDERLALLRIESNLRIASLSWLPSRGERAFASTEEIGTIITPLICGRYVWGSFNKERVIAFLRDQNDRDLSLLQMYLEDRFWYMYKEGGEKYRERLHRYHSIRESKER